MVRFLFLSSITGMSRADDSDSRQLATVLVPIVACIACLLVFAIWSAYVRSTFHLSREKRKMSGKAGSVAI